MDRIERTIGILEEYLIELSNIPIEEQIQNPVLMIASTDSIKQLTMLLFILNKT